MTQKFLSVIIPTFNRADKLDICLKCLLVQTLAKEAFEVIIVDDGSTDDTKELLKKWQTSDLTIKVLHQQNLGQGIARNKAIKEATGLITVFIGDDIYIEPNFLELHSAFHQKHPEENYAMLGLIEWYKAKPITPFMQWLTNGGPQFAYHKLDNQKPADFWFFYTSNISLKTALLQKEPFDEDFSLYGWEDIELGYRLKKNHKLKLIFNASALAHHDHIMEEDSLKTRMEGIGKNAVLFQKKHQELQVTPTGLKLFLLSIISNPLVLFFLKPIKRLYWYALSKRYFLKGMRGL